VVTTGVGVGGGAIGGRSPGCQEGSAAGRTTLITVSVAVDCVAESCAGAGDISPPTFMFGVLSERSAALPRLRMAGSVFGLGCIGATAAICTGSMATRPGNVLSDAPSCGAIVGAGAVGWAAESRTSADEVGPATCKAGVGGRGVSETRGAICSGGAFETV